MAFNFKTKKGLITQVYTQQEDGFLTSEIAKRGANGELFLQHGRYTTCDEPHPDFYLALSRAKVRPGKDVVFGPAYLVVCDVPLPLAIPYGFFPFTKSYSSGLIMPTYGDETERGFYLRDGGYYFAISDKIDLKLIGEIYTKGSWGISGASNYRKRYKYSGSFLASYQNTVNGEKNSSEISYLTVYPYSGIDELASGKQIANVRYYNLAGQEIAQPSGLTIQVTTYTDGTRTATKVIK
jgi:lipopolysaccharide assembly outer membrane protein LptD (OstA)